MKINAKIDRVCENEDSNVKALASVTLDDAFAIHGVKVIEMKNGATFVAMPTRSYVSKDGETKYADICHPVTKEAHSEISDVVLGAYEKSLIEELEELDETSFAQSM